MTIEDAVRRARNPQEAMLVIARSLDVLSSKLDMLEELVVEQHNQQDSWGWDDDAIPTDPVADLQLSRESIPAIEEPAPIELLPEPDYSTMDPADAERVRQARARLAQDKPGQYISDTLAAGNAAKIGQTGDDSAIVDLPPVDDERKATRREFAKQIGIPGQYPTFPEEDILHAYELGGPMWLYLNDRDFVMKLPDVYRQQMVLDVMQDSERDGTNMGRDILKSTTLMGADQARELYGSDS